ncbi:MAG TPA: divergent polysaccharide deacetylase family protein [Holophagaceae bacterium]|nr:divergent polysaccharide deacetylase family protein [Holophagaceae bacterium]
MRKKGGASTPKLLGWAAAAIALGLGVGQLLGHLGCERKPSKPAPRPEPGARSPEPKHPKPETRKPELPAPEAGSRKPEAGHEPDERLPKFALIIDDLGYMDPALVKRLCQEPVPFSTAVLPYQEHTKESAEIVHAAGKEVMLHLPMEGRADKDPGPDALKFDLPEGEIRARTRKALADVPFIAGANNHMGSRMTADEARMHWILEEFRNRRLYFIDSRTTAATVGWKVAGELGIPTVQRNVFLDDDKSFPEIEKQWKRAIDIAKKDGQVVVIGHIYPETVEALEKLIPETKGQVTFIKASEVVR